MFMSGGTLIVDHGHGLSSTFIHLSKILVQAGEAVTQGQRIALVGQTGRASGPHLHWAMNWFDTRVDPQTLLSAP
jgi:murein DD-endopeptidase MepM/ murein hydrolase activator NlpD